MESLVISILSLAGIVISTFGPTAARAAGALISGADPVAAVADESVGDILLEKSHVDDAMAFAHAHEAAAKLKHHDESGDIATAGLNSDQLAVVAHAFTTYDLVTLKSGQSTASKL